MPSFLTWTLFRCQSAQEIVRYLGISNGRVEAINNKIKVTVRMGYGFRNTDNLVALLMLRCGDCQPQLPGRPVKARKKGVKGAKSVAA